MSDHETAVAELAALLADAPTPDLRAGTVDQLVAASRDARALLERFGPAAETVEPGRWANARTAETDDLSAARAATARVILALGGATYCAHLRSGGPQPATARLGLHRVDCQRCTATVRRPPPDEGDRCDWCGARGVTTFIPVVLQVGPLLTLGDACVPCGTSLRTSAEVGT